MPSASRMMTTDPDHPAERRREHRWHVRRVHHVEHGAEDERHRAHRRHPGTRPARSAPRSCPRPSCARRWCCATVMNVSLRLPPVSRSVTIEWTAISRSGSGSRSDMPTSASSIAGRAGSPSASLPNSSAMGGLHLLAASSMACMQAQARLQPVGHQDRARRPADCRASAAAVRTAVAHPDVRRRRARDAERAPPGTARPEEPGRHAGPKIDAATIRLGARRGPSAGTSRVVLAHDPRHVPLDAPVPPRARARQEAERDARTAAAEDHRSTNRFISSIMVTPSGGGRSRAAA